MVRHSTKASEKRDSLQREISEQKKKRNRRKALAVILIAVASVSGTITYSVLNQSSPSQAVSFKAAIIDQLSGTSANPSFNDSARSILVGAGYTVDYYSPDQITVQFFRTLPSKDYGLIIIRAHSTGGITGDPITIFTSEPYIQSSYTYEQLAGQLTKALLFANSRTYFAITAQFVQDAMQGRFPDSIVIMMGCTGLKDSDMAQAFVSKGARVYVSWDNSVTVDRSDNTVVALLRSLAQGQTMAHAVSAAMDEVGPDLIHNSKLGYYPDDQATLMLNMQHNPTMTNVQVLASALGRS
jgi:hypothetical protein